MLIARLNQLTLLVAGLLVAVIGGGLAALLTDTVTSDDNSGETGAFQRPAEPAHDVVATFAEFPEPGQFVPASQACPVSASDRRYEDGPLTALWDSAFIPMNGASAPKTSEYVCVANAGSEPAWVSMLFTDVVDLEVGCPPSEAAVDNTCGEGERGELSRSSVFRATITVGHVGPGRADCSTYSNGDEVPFSGYTTSRSVISFELEPGGACWVELGLHVAAAEPGASDYWPWEVIQYDRIQFDIEFDAVDPL